MSKKDGQGGHPYLRTGPAADYLGLGQSTLEKLRCVGGGPRYAKIGRTVVYDIDDLDAYVTARRRRSTSEALSSGGVS